MRKASREMDATFAFEVLDKAPYVTVSFTRPDGSPYIVSDKEGKIEAMRAICLRFLPKHMDAFDDAIQRSLERTAVVKITLTAPPTGKRKQYDKQGEEMKWGRME